MEGNMKKLIFVVSLVLLFCLVVYCQTQAEKPKPPANYKNEIIAIRELFVVWAKAFEAKDADRICSFVTDDFAMGYGDRIRDKKWLREFYIKRFSEGASWKIWPTVLIEISDSLDLAFSINNYEYTTVTKGEAKTAKSWALSALKKQKDGSWKFVSFN
jgi:ketosteroid isomerase-like protein